MQETQEAQVRSLGWEDPLEKELTIHSSKLAWEIPRTEEPGRLQSMGLQRVRHGWEFQYYFASNTNLPQKFPKGQVYLLKAYRVVIYSIALTHFFPMVISGSSAFSKSSLNNWNFTIHVLLKPGMVNFEHYFASMWKWSCSVVSDSLRPHGL